MNNQSNCRIVSLFIHLSKEQFNCEYEKLYSNKKIDKRKKVYMEILDEIQISIKNGDLELLQKSIDFILLIHQAEKLKMDVMNKSSNKIFLPEIWYKECENKNLVNYINLITLSCKYNQLKILNYILFNSECNLKYIFEEIGVNCEINPCDLDNEKQNIFYYAVRSGNTDILEILINKWQNDYFILNKNVLKEILENAYNDMKLVNIPISENMEIFVENKLINLRFQESNDKRVKPAVNDVENRIQIIVDGIEKLEKYSKSSENRIVDSEFLFISKFIAKNLYVLKKLLNSTYNRIPWEEIEFFLVCFIGSHLKQQEINYVIKAFLTKENLLNYLILFKNEITLIKIQANDIGSKLPSETRQELIERLSLKNYQFKKLYDDYEIIKDVYSLEKINYYIKVAIECDQQLNSDIDSFDNHEQQQILIERALQVTGEFLKNTLESPHMSENLSNAIFVNFHKETKQIITRLRDRLSHTIIQQYDHTNEYLFGRRLDNVVLSKYLKVDLIKLNNNIDVILFNNKIEILKKIIENILLCDNIDGIKEFAKFFNNLNFNNISLASRKSYDYSGLLKSIKEFQSLIENPTEFEQSVFNNIEETLKQNIENDKTINVKLNYFQNMLSCMKFVNKLEKINNVETIKKYANNILKQLKTSIEPNEIEDIYKKVCVLCYSAYDRKTFKDIKEFELAVHNVFSKIIYDIGTTNTIRKLKRNLESNIENDNLNNELKNILEKIKKQLINQPEYYDILHKKINNYKEQYEIKKELIELIDDSDSDMTKRNSDHFEQNVKKLHFKKDKEIKIIKYYNSCNWIACKQQLQLDSYKNLLAAIEHLIRTGEFLKVHKAIVELFPGKTVENNFKTKLKEILDDILNHQENIFRNHFNKKLKFLKNILFQQSENITEVILKIKNNDRLKVIVEMLVLDIISFIEEKEKLLDTTLLSTSSFLDNSSPLLIGKQLRNYLAHGNPLVEIILRDPSISIISNAIKFVNEDILVNRKCIQQHSPNFDYIKSNYEKDLKLIQKQKIMLHIAEKGTIDELVNYQNQGVDLTSRDITNQAALEFATKGDKLDIVEYLYNIDNKHLQPYEVILANASCYGSKEIVTHFIKYKNLNLNKTINKHGATLLHCAATFGHVDILEILLKSGAKIGNELPTQLHAAAEHGHVNTVKILLNVNGVDVNYINKGGWTPLQLAAESGHFEIVELLLSCGARVDSKRKEEGWTALHFAAYYGYENVVEILLKHNANINELTDQDMTPLHLAIENGHENVVNILLQNPDIDGNYVNSLGFAPIHVAANYGYCEIVDLLIMKGVSTNTAAAYGGFSPIHYATISGHSEVVKLLLNKGGIELNYNSWILLHAATRYGHLETIKILLEKGIDVNIKNEDNETPLHVAVDHPHIVEFLLDNGADIDAKADLEYTALHFAARSGSSDTVLLLLSKGIDVNAKTSDNDGMPLHHAAECGHLNIVEILLNAGANIDDVTIDKNETALFFAAAKGHTDIVKLLLERNANTSVATKLNFTALHAAAVKGDPETFEALLNACSNTSNIINIKDGEGLSPLQHAAHNGHLEIARILLSKGADVNFRGNEGETPLHHAAQSGFYDITFLLVSYGADINSKSHHGLMPIHLAAQHRSIDITELFLNKEVYTDAKTFDYGYTPVFYAARNGNTEIIELLLSKNADVNAQAHSGLRPLHVAACNGHSSAVELLLNNGADINARENNSNSTPLHFAVDAGHVDVVKILLSRDDIDVNATNKDGDAPIQRAVYKRSCEIINILVDNGANINIRVLCDTGVPPLQIAAIIGFLEGVDCLLKLGANIDEVDENGHTLLHIAALEGKHELVELLIAKGADINKTTKHNFTPLHFAVENGHIDVVNILLNERGIDVNIANHMGIASLHYAVTNDHVELVKVLLEKGADLTKSIDQGCTASALHFAAFEGHLKIVELLLNHLNDPNSATFYNGWTALHLAAGKGYTDIVEVLLEKGADVHAKNKKASINNRTDIKYTIGMILEGIVDKNTFDDHGVTPLHLAAGNGHSSIVELLLAHGSNPNAATIGQGMTALHLAALKKHVSVVKILLSEANIDINYISNNGWTPFHFAVQSDNYHIVRLFLINGVDSDVVSAEGVTAMEYAVENGQTAIVNLLNQATFFTKRR